MTATTVLALLAGFVVLLGGAEVLIRGAARLAARTGMSPVVIGLTVIAFGTSTPELAIGVGDAISGDSDAGALAIGNVLGSNIANVLLVLGLAAVVGGSLFVAQRIIRLDVPIMIGVSLLVLVFVLDNRIGQIEGAVLAALLVAYLVWTVVAARRSTPDVVAEYDEALDPDALRRTPLVVDVGYVVAGIALLVLGSRLLVDAAGDIASALGVSDLLVGLTVVAIGTSLPEIATSVLAALRGERDLAVGNAIGSNLFNLLAVLGITALVSPTALPVDPSAVRIDVPVMVAVAVLCLPVFANGSVLDRREGVIFVALYAAYVGWLVVDALDHGLRGLYGSVMVFVIVPLVSITVVVVWARGRSDAISADAARAG
jgi:cation:H+ antiporter